jgi:hypothetical protein
MTIHTVGDSHARFGWSAIPGVSANHIGAILCHSFGREGRGRVDIRGLGLRDGDSVIFCMGEIDSRCHVNRQSERQGVSFRDIIDALVEAYMIAIADNVAGLDVSLRCVGVYNIVPSVEFHTVVQHANPDFPQVGTDEERREYVMYFNYRLRVECAKRGFLFVDVFAPYADARGFLRKEYSDDSVHIADPCHIMAFLVAHGLM